MSSGNPVLWCTPKTWDDRCFIRSGILKKLQWDILSGTQGDQETCRRRHKIVRTLLESRRDCKVIEAWLGQAFSSKLAVNTETVTLFLDIQQKLSQGREPARLLLEEERFKRNRSRSITVKLPSFSRLKDRNVGTSAISIATKDEDYSHRTSNSLESRSPSFVRHASAQPQRKGSADLGGDTLSLLHAMNHKEESVPNAQPDTRPVAPRHPSNPVQNLSFDHNSDGQTRLYQRGHSMALKRRAPSNPAPRKKKGGLADCPEQLPCLQRDEKRSHLLLSTSLEDVRYSQTHNKGHREEPRNEHSHFSGHGTSTISINGQLMQADSQPIHPKQELSEHGTNGTKPAFKIHRMESVPLDSSGLGIEVKAVDQEIHSSLDDGLAVSYFPKPRLPRLPPIWAESRQEVCETFDWFRSYQGGVYHVDNSVKGYLLSAFPSRRDAFEHGGKLIISHGGGKAESTHCQQGVTVSHQASDQLAEDKSVKALLDNYRTGRPLVLLIDDKYVLFPYDLASEGVSYAVLGFYSIVYAWAEYQQAKTPTSRIMRYKFAFRWCEEQGEPWWHTASDLPVPLSMPEKSTENDWVHTPLTTLKNPDKPRKITETKLCHADAHRSVLLPPVPSSTLASGVCVICCTSSSQVYSIWVCLMPNCAMFWRNPEGKEFLADTIQYNDRFFELASQHRLSHGLRLLPPPAITCAMNGTSTGYAFTRGMHCHQCGRLSCRYQWEKLECVKCQHVQPANLEIRFAKDFWGDRLPISFERFSMSSVSDIMVEPMCSFHHDHGRGTVQTFTLPHNRGHLHHIRMSSPASMEEADEVFVKYQEQARSGQLRLRRWPMRAHRCRGNLLTNYFSHNAGEPYHYVGGDANTVPFEQVPAVVEARTLIQKRTLQAIDKDVEFNEVLSCAYMERQQMAFHSDAEVGLGPLVAGLSLGSPALMHFRLHARHDPLYERRGILLTVVLRHGDVLIMDGTKVQEYYEHTVVPNNFRIAATARQITPQHHSSSITIG